MMDENKYNSSGKAVKAGLAYLSGTVFVRGFSLISTPVFARILSTEDYGKVGNFNAWAAILICFTGLGLTYSIGNAWIKYRKEFDSYMASMVLLIGITLFLFLSVVFVFKAVFNRVTHIPPCLMYYMGGYLFFWQIENFASLSLTFAYKAKQVLVISAFECVLGFILSLGLINMKLFDNYAARIIGMTFPTYVIGGCYALRLFQFIRWKSVSTFWKYSLEISLPMVPHGLAMIILAQVDRVMINNYCGSSDLGLYNMGYTYGTLVLIIANSMSSATLPWIYERLNEKKYSSIREIQKNLVFLITIICLIQIQVAPEAIVFLGGEKYINSLKVISPVILAALFQYLYTFYCKIENFYKKNMYIAIASIMAGALNFVLNYVLIPEYGYYAAAYTTVICYMVLYFFHMFVSRKILSFEMYNLKLNFFCIVLLLILASLFNEIRVNSVLRIAILIFIVAVYLIIEKKKIFYMLELVRKK